MQDVRLG